MGVSKPAHRTAIKTKTRVYEAEAERTTAKTTTNKQLKGEFASTGDFSCQICEVYSKQLQSQ